MKGASIMNVEDMVKVAVKGMQTDQFEIRPGQANQLNDESRGAPIYFETNEPVGRSYAQSTGLIRRVAIKRAAKTKRLKSWIRSL
jgi:uncharacterized oxidoreductase